MNSGKCLEYGRAGGSKFIGHGDNILGCGPSPEYRLFRLDGNLAHGSGNRVDSGEQVGIVVTLTGLTPPLGKNKEFTINVKPQSGALLTINRAMPAELFRSLILE